MKPLVRFGRRLTRDAALYAVGSGVTLAISLVAVAVLTRYLSPGEFGELAVLLFFSALLSVLYNLGFLQGSLIAVFGSAGEEEADEMERNAGAADKRRALGSALTLTVIVGIAGTGLAALVSHPLAVLLLGDGEHAATVVIAAASGGLGALWRLTSNVPRLERRPATYVLLSAARPIFVLCISVPLVASGLGAKGAIAGVSLGSALAVVIGLTVIRRSYRPAFSRDDAKRIFLLGAPVVPVVVAFWVIQNVDIYVLSKFAPDRDVGLYRLGARLASVVSYFVSAFLMAWGPLTLTSTFAAASNERGPVGVGSRLLTYYVITGLGLALLLMLGADLLVTIAPPAYGGAASLVPLLAVGFLVYGAFIVLFRASRFPRRRRIYGMLAAGSAVAFLVAALILTAAFGAYGAAAAPIIAFVAGSAALVWISQRGPQPIPFEHGRLAGAVALASVCAVGGKVLGAWLPAAEVGGLLAYSAGLVLFGIVPREHLRELMQVAGGVLPDRAGRRALGERLRLLPSPDRAALELVVRHRRSPAALAHETSLSEEAIQRRFVRGLRVVAGVSVADDDHGIAAYLLSGASVAERDGLARGLWEDGVDADAVDRLEFTYGLLASASAGFWRTAG